MSMNIYITARRKVQVLKTGEIVNQVESYTSAWQTTTEETHKILEADNPLNAYCKWVLDNSYDIEEPLYHYSDPFGEGDVIGYETINYGKRHIDCLKRWIEEKESRGYDIVITSM